MRRLFNYAVEREIIAASPVRVSAPKIKGSSLDVGKIASPHQVAALAAAMPGPLRLSVLLAAWCSLRQGEALGLQRRDIIGLESGSPRLRIERQWNQKAVPPGYTTPKSGAAREVTIPTALVPVIRDHLDIYVADDKDAPVFPSPIEPGKPISQTNHNKAWAAARVAAGMPSFRFHDLRHTGLTLYAQQGATLAEIMERGGSPTASQSSYKKRSRPASILAGTIFFMSHSRGAFPRPRSRTRYPCRCRSRPESVVSPLPKKWVEANYLTGASGDNLQRLLREVLEALGCCFHVDIA